MALPWPYKPVGDFYADPDFYDDNSLKEIKEYTKATILMSRKGSEEINNTDMNLSRYFGQEITGIDIDARIDEDDLDFYGKYKAKIDYNLLKTNKRDKKSKLINGNVVYDNKYYGAIVQNQTLLNDVDYVQQLIDNDLIGYTEILIGELGYNFVLDEDTDGLKLKHDLEDKMEKYIFKLGYVPLIDLEDKHFSCLKELTPNDK